MKELERLVRSIQADGLLWGASKLEEVAYGIKKLRICCVVEDDKVTRNNYYMSYHSLFMTYPTKDSQNIT